MKSRGFNVVAAERKRDHHLARRVRRGHADRAHRIASAAIAGNRFIVAQIRRGAARLSSLGYRRCRYFVSSPPPFLPHGFPFLIPVSLPLAVASEAQNCSASSLTFRFSLFLLARRGIETELLLTLAHTDAFHHRCAARCWWTTSRRAVTDARANFGAQRTHKDGSGRPEERCNRRRVSFPRGEKTRGRKWVRRRKGERRTTYPIVGLHPARRLRELARARKPREDCETRAARLANLAGEWPAKIIRFFATRSL